MTSIVVGIDGSENSVAALQWAAHEAELRNCKVRVVSAWEYPYAVLAPSPVALPLPAVTEMQEAANTLLEQVLTEAKLPDGVTVEHVVVEGSPAKVLLDEAAKDAELLVIGARGRGGFMGLLLGSVATQVVHHSQVPTVVVRAPQLETQPEGHEEESR
jgi:nucleotide-binding universal stress UspA family protein